MKKFLKKNFLFFAMLFALSLSALGQWSISGNNLVNINTGSIGIGTSSPSSSYKLNVKGNSLFEGNLNLTGTISQNGNALTPNGPFNKSQITTVDYDNCID